MPATRWRRGHDAEQLAGPRYPRMQRFLARVVERVAADAVGADALARLRRAVPVGCAAVPLAVDEREHPLVAFDQRASIAEERHTRPDAETRVINAQLIRHPVGVGDRRRVL